MPPLTATDIKASYAKAMSLLNDGKPEAALQILGEIVEANPNLPEVHFQIGRIFLSADRYDRANTHFAAAARLRPQESAVWAGWAAAVALLGDTDAEKAFLAALKPSPLPPEIKLALQDRFGARRAASRPATGGVDRVIRNEQTGLLFENGNTDELAAAMQRMISDIPFRKQAGKAAAQSVDPYFSDTFMVESLCRLYREVVQ